MKRKMPQIRKILVPIDFSSHSAKAVDYASLLAQQFNATMILMHVIDSAPYSVTDTFNVVEHRHALETIARSLLDNWTAPLLEKNLSVKRYLANGIAYREILEKARHDKADLIVMGTHGRTGLEHVLLGSVAEKVVRLSGCPVLTIPVSRGRKPRPVKLHRRPDVVLI